MKKLPSPGNLILMGAAIILVGGIFLWARSVGGQSPGNEPVFQHDHLTIQRADGQTFAFDVEVATTPQQEAYGLMFRRSLPSDAGMIFISDPDRVVSMWMKNTYIPLDMLFVRHDGTIVKMVTHAVPFDLTPLSSGDPVHAVIELNAGEIERQGLKTGDKVIFSAFSSTP